MNNSMNTELMIKAEAALSKAKISLMTKPDSVFFTTLCFSLKHKWDVNIPTARTTGKTVYYNPEFFTGLTTDVQTSVLIHETMHCAYLHIERFVQGMCHDRANRAMDYVINLQMKKRGFTIPDTWCCDEKYDGMCWEEVYKLLPNNPGKPIMDDLGELEGDPSEVKQYIEDILVQAQIQSQLANDKAGTIPGDIEIFLNKLLNPKLPWTRILQKYLHSFSKNDYTYKRPNRRFFPQYHLPSLYSENLMDITVAIDTSGSVSDSDFMRFVSEIAGIFKMMKPENITLLQFDTSIKSVTKIKSLQEFMKVTFSGRGGTDINDVIEWANTNKPQLMLTFTDGEFSFPDITSKINYLWLINGSSKFTAPYGKTIRYEV